MTSSAPVTSVKSKPLVRSYSGTTHQWPRQLIPHRDYPKYRLNYPEIPRHSRKMSLSTLTWHSWVNRTVATIDSRVAGSRRTPELKAALKERREWEKFRTAEMDHKFIGRRLAFNIREQENPTGDMRIPLLQYIIVTAFLLVTWNRREKTEYKPISWFPWVQLRLWSALFEIQVLPVRVRIYLFGDIIIGAPKRRYGPFSWSPEPGLTDLIAHMPVYESFATLAETTTTADPGAAGTSLALTSRSLFPQDTTTQFHIVVMDADPTNPTQPKYPPTNREVMLATAGHGTGAGSFTVARGREGTAGVAHGIGSYVAQTITATGLKNLKLNAVGMSNAKDQYGAKGDSSTADTTAIQNAIAGLQAQGIPWGTSRTGTVYLPASAGSYRITGLVMPNDSTNSPGWGNDFRILGEGGKNAGTMIQRVVSSNAVMIDLSGTNTAGTIKRSLGPVVENLFFFGWDGVSGVSGPEPHIRGYYTANSLIRGCRFNANNGACWEGVEWQDAWFEDNWIDDCAGTVSSNQAGTAGGTESIRFVSRKDNAAGAGTFGVSNDACKDLWIIDTRITGNGSGRAGDIVIAKNGSVGTVSNPTRFYFTNLKMEHLNMNGNVVKLFDSFWIRFLNTDFTGYSVSAGAAITWLESANCNTLSFRQCVFDDSGNAGVSHAAMKLTACSYVTLEDVVIEFGTAGAEANSAVVAEFVGTANDQFYINNQGFGAGTRLTPLYTGTLPSNFFGPARVYNLRVAADQALAAGVGIQSITALVFAAGTNTIWNLDCLLSVANTSGSGGVKIAITIPTGANMSVYAYGNGASATAFTSQTITASATLTTVIFNNVLATTAGIRLTGTVEVVGTAGNIQIGIGKVTTGDTVVVKKNSNLIAQKI